MSIKIVSIRVVTALLVALLGAFGIHTFIPDLSNTSVYQHFTELRPPVAVARDILLIDVPLDTGKAGNRRDESLNDEGRLSDGLRITPDAFDWAEILLLMTEFEAAQGIFLFAPTEAPPTEHSLKLKHKVLTGRFDQEFSVMSSNVLAFFEAIRLGSVRPRDSVRYVDDLLKLMEDGKNRLVEDVRASDETETVLVNQALDVFGRAWIDYPDAQTGIDYPDAQSGTETGIQLSLHTRGRSWSIAVFRALMYRLGGVVPDLQENALVLPGVRLPGRDEQDIVLPLGRDGSVLFETPDPDRDDSYRSLKPAVILHAAELETSLYKSLKIMEGSGYLSGMDPESYPTALYEHTMNLRREMLAAPDSRKLDGWRQSRERFFTATRVFLEGEAEQALLDGYDELVAAETLEEAGRQRVEELRQSVVRAFSDSRNKLIELELLRQELDAELRGSFCIIGPGPEVEAEAGLVNAILANRFIDGLWGQRLNRWAALPGLVLSVPLAFIGPLLALVAGVAAAALSFGMMALLFIYAGLWIHPVLPAGIIAAVTISSALTCLVLRHGNKDKLRTAFGKRLPRTLMRDLASAGLTQTTEVRNSKAVILAIRYIHTGDHGRPEEDPGQAASLKSFQDLAAQAIVKQGGVVLGADGYIILGAFGAPLEAGRLWKGKDPEPEPAAVLSILANKACAATLAIMGPETGADNFWRYGMDIGECAFFHSDAGGYSVVGRPPVYARILSGLALKYSCRILVTQELKDTIGEKWLTRRLDTLVAKSSGREEAFYELSGQPWH
jgi:class 3 adenylate cyclase